MINSHNDNPESCTVSQIIMFLWVLYHKNVHFLSLKATQALSHIIKTLEIYSRFQKKSNLWITSKSDSKFPKNIHVCVCTHMKMKFFLVEYRNSWVCMRVMAFDWFGPQFYVDIDKPLRIQYILVSHTRKILFSSNCSYFYLTLRLFYHCYFVYTRFHGSKFTSASVAKAKAKFRIVKFEKFPSNDEWNPLIYANIQISPSFFSCLRSI